VKLAKLDAANARRRKLADVYGRRLAGCGFVLPEVEEGREHAFHLYVIECEDRDELMAFMRNQGIGAAVHYPAPVHRQEAYASRVLAHPDGLLVTERVCERIVSLPMYPELTEAMANRVCDVLSGWGQRRR